MRHTEWQRVALRAALAAATLFLASCGGSDDDDDPAASTVAPSGITRLEITSRVPAFDGTSFGAVGAYEKLRGTAYGELNPNDPRNQVIVDLALAPRNANGRIAYSMDFYILKPVDLATIRATLEGTNKTAI